ncbi:type VI secretion protein [Bombella intestini]|uniref:Type VI secretion protein n=1 Tax=Bombella intestini TaxID=1539051 RepID=A0A1S8GSK5_9PROT|nr:type IV secretion system protein VirB10 [Bombella intestini]OOL19955.1 type VI secretion protein [Bombella intestini]
MSDKQDNHDSPESINQGGSMVSDETRRELTSWQKVGIAALVAVVMLGFVWLRAGDGPKKTEQVAVQRATVSPGYHLRSAPPAPPPPPVPMPVQPQLQRMPLVTPRSTRHEMNPAESPIFAVSGEAGGAASAPASAPSVVGGGGQQGPGSDGQFQKPAGEAEGSPLAANLKPTLLAGARAHMLPHPDFLITKGTIIPCILQTRLNTQLAGYTKCVVPMDIRSTTGNVVLLDKGTLVTGEMQHGLLQGEDRVFVVWDRAETPEHSVIELDSPATDELGQSGIGVTVNNHWWKRFGSAILLSVIQGALDVGVEAASRIGASGSSGGSYFNSFQSNGQTVANSALQAGLNIQPTGEKSQGKTVAIFVARDLDFSGIYELRTTAGGYGQ